jgi:hypothetical protein
MDTTISPATLPAQEFRLADVAIYPAGEKQRLVYARESGSACLLHPTYVDLLTGCHDFQSLDAHLAAFCQGRQLDERVRQGLRHKLAQLARDGYLVSRAQIRTRFQQSSTSPLQITTLGIPTCNRVEALQRGLISYIEHTQRFGRRLDFAVMDDSATASTRQTYRDVLRALQARYGVPILYAGLEEKRTFARILQKAADIPAEVICWACVGNREYGASTSGANRNALLLHTVGECLFSSDDDVVCRVAGAPEIQHDVMVSSKANIQTWFYPDRQSALAATCPADVDILAMHEHWLGQDPCQGHAPHLRDSQIDVAQAEPALLRRLGTQPGKVLVTAHGIVGDISCQSSDILLVCEHLMCDEHAYLTAYARREIAQGARRVTLTQDASYISGMCIGGMDNRELLPPFGPFGRCDDLLFSHTLAKCFSTASVVYLPWMLLHDPLEQRRFSGPLLDIPFDIFLIGCIRVFQQELPGALTPVAQLERLSQFLEHIGQLPTPTFEAFVRQIYWQGQGSMLTLLEQRLHEYGDRCAASWKRDVEAYCTQARRALLEPVHCRLPDGAETVQRAARQFAQVLKWWPAMVEAARRLRTQGYRLAQAV